ncbi:hypothetical protein BC332_25564 [Capsicum chinense]|nr:hypothetical protein BC332_25564 [Capsicum chinense]
MPMDYTLVWSSKNLKIKQDSFGYIWLPIPLEVYKAIGYVVITSPYKPSVDKPYTKGQESLPIGIQPTGSNLPQGGSNDCDYWLDLPTDDPVKSNVNKGNLLGATAYLRIKPMFGATYTDIDVWLFYLFNGPAKAKLEFMTIALGKIGEHLEFQSSNQPVVYSSLHGYAAYPKPAKNLQGSRDVGIRNDTRKGKLMDIGANFSVIATEYLGSTIVEPPWLNYTKEWVPKISYDISK